MERPDPPPTVLVVDDNVATRRLISAVLSRDGFRVLAAQDADEALAASEAEARLDVLVTDFALPGTTGADVGRSIALRHPRIRLLYVSGYSAADLAKRGVAEDSDPILQKPFALDELLRTVRELAHP